MTPCRRKLPLGPTVGQAPWSGCAAAHTDRSSPMGWRVRRGHHQACGAVVGIPGSGSSVGGGCMPPPWRQHARLGASRSRAGVLGTVVPRALPVPAASAALSQGPPGVAASGSQGGTRVRGGGQSLGGPGTRRGLQPPNTALEATGHSVRFVAGVGLYRVARASAWAFGGPRGGW
jgi:hypothetical protein